jgi:hypothetical protein
MARASECNAVSQTLGSVSELIAEYALGRFGIGLGQSARRSSRSGVTVRWAYGGNGTMARRPAPPLGERGLVLARPVRVVFLRVEFVAPDKVVALVDDGSGRQAADQRYVVILVVLDKSSRLDVFSLGEKGQYLQHVVAPSVPADS